MRKTAIGLTAFSLIASLSAVPALAEKDDHGQHDNGKHLGWYKQQYSVSFDDIDGDFSWAKDAIQQLAKEGIVHGVDAKHFQPNGQLTRAQFAALVSNYFSLQPANSNQEDFQDVHVGDWYFKAVEASKDYMTMFTNVSGGYDFKPNLPINRAEAAVTLVQVLLKQNAIQLVSADQANQILSGYTDANLIPQQLRIHVATAIQAGLMKGIGANRFDPLTTLNRAQAAALLYRLQNQLQIPPIDSNGNPVTEVPPGTPSSNPGSTNGTLTVTYQSPSYVVSIGNPIYVSSSQFGSVYLIPNNYTAPNSVSSLDDFVNANLGSKTSVTQANTSVALSTANLAGGYYSIYAADLYGNITKLNNTVQLVSSQSAAISSVQLQSNTTDSSGAVHLTLNIQTTNVSNNTQAVAELVTSGGSSLNPSLTAQTTIYNNSGTVTLDIPAGLQSGNYKVKVTVGNSINQSVNFTK